METIYVSNETFGSVSLVGTWEQFKEGMKNCFEDWYSNALDTGRIDESCTFEQFVDECMDDGLDVATDEDIEKYEHI